VQLEQRVKDGNRWSTVGDRRCERAAQLALVFGPMSALHNPETWAELRALYPAARLVGCSTAGEIAGPRVLDDTLVVTAIAFEHGHVAVASVRLHDAPDSEALGRLLASRLPRAGLVHAFVLSDGIHVNGSALVSGITGELGAGIAVTGGLSADGARFTRTAVCVDGPTPSSQVVAVGLYGDRLKIGYGSRGGWEPFGPERRITRSAQNVLYELDGEPAFDLYRRYLGEHADGLPASGLMFPLAIRPGTEGEGPAVVRTILAVDGDRGSLRFAGDVPTGYRARLMRASFERLVEGASGASRASIDQGDPQVELAILISCVGRRLVLKQRVEEEVEAVRDVLAPGAMMTGFYSYGEIAPFSSLEPCTFHNQTMTITTLSER
jgi:hypothetical protein